MAQARSPESSAERLLKLIESYNLYHVKTLHYDDVQGVLEWLGIRCHTVRGEDTVTVLQRCLGSSGLTSVGLMSINEVPNIEDKDRLLVYIKRGRCNTERNCSSIVLFRVVQCNKKTPPSASMNAMIERARRIRLIPQSNLFPKFAAGCYPQQGNPEAQQQQQVDPKPQQLYPVIDGFLPLQYKTVKPRTETVMIDTFGRKYEPLQCTAEADPWSLYADVENTAGTRDSTTCDFDIEQLITTPNTVMGRGGFGVTVQITDDLVAKTNLFPEMVDWSVPFIAEEFNRYAHIASQVEEIMIGVSLKHPNILRTFGGFWCEIPGYQLGGRGVLVMERALCSLQEFVGLYIKNTSVIPAVELDTLKGLDYLRSRTIQHRDFTYRNVLVCSQPERRPLPFAFKISDFGTACNFSTPDQPRGNRTNMAPEVLWCLNATTGSDIFSWYCVMWELYNGSPLVDYKDRISKSGYCKQTYAEKLSDLVGVYSPTEDTTFKHGYMTRIKACALYATHKDKRPTAEEIDTKLNAMGNTIQDKQFVSMGKLCITLFPQERWSPSELLNLNRYKCLSEDISPAGLPASRMPLSVRAGEYKPSDIIVADDCVPEGLVTKSVAGPPVTVISSKSKKFYGIDLMRLAPGYIQPYEWYRKKVKQLEVLYDSKYNKTQEKRKGCDTQNPVDARRSRQEDPDEGTLRRVNGRQPVVARHALHKGNLVEMLSCSDVGDKGQHMVMDATNAQGSSVVNTLAEGEDHGEERIIEDSPLSTSKSRVYAAPVEVRESQSTVIAKVKRAKGEMDIMMIILKSHNEQEMRRFKDNVILLSQSMTQMHPVMFAGPREGLCKCSRRTGMFIFQYAQAFEGWEQLVTWKPSPNCSVFGVLLQVFLTLKQALDKKLLPTHMTESGNLLVSKGAVMIDIVPYLCKNFNELQSSMFGEQCTNLVRFCAALVTKHLPDSDLCIWLSRLNTTTAASDVLTQSINWLRQHLCQSVERMTPNLLTLRGNVVTFKEYSSDIPNWLTCKGEEDEEATKCSAKLLVYGDPNPFRCNLQAGGPDHTLLHTLVKNIVMRMKVRVFGSSRLQVTTLDCTQGFVKVILNTSALSGITRVDQLDRSIVITGTDSAIVDRLDRSLQTKDNVYFTHDAVTGSKWAPVIMFTKLKKQGPVADFTFDFYKMTILLVILNRQGLIKSLSQLFRDVATFSVTDY